MKLSVASLSSSLHFNFKTPVPPPPTPPPPHGCSNSSPTLLSSPFPLLLAFYHPLIPAFFRVFTDGHGGPSSHPPSGAKTSELVLPHPSALRSHRQPFPIAFFPFALRSDTSLCSLRSSLLICRSLSSSYSLSAVLSLTHDSLGVLMQEAVSRHATATYSF